MLTGLVRLGSLTFMDMSGHVCKQELFVLLEIQSRLEEVQRELESGKQLLKERAKGCENVFEKENIYRREGRYHQIRKLFLGQKVVIHSLNPQRVSVGGANGGRSSSTRSRVTRLSARETESKVDDSSRSAALHVNNVEVNDKFIFGNPTRVSEAKTDLDMQNEEVNNGCSNNTLDIHRESAPDESTSSLPMNRSGFGNARKRRKRTVLKKPKLISSDDDFEAGQSDCEQFPSMSTSVKRKDWKQRKKQDDDFVPSRSEESTSSAEDVGEEKDEIPESDQELLEDGVKKKVGAKAKYKLDPVTGNFKGLGITLNKIGDNQYKCSSCEQVIASTSRDSLRKHVIYKHTDKLVCKICKHRCNTGASLRMHISQVHKKDEVLYTCPVCGKPWRYKQGMTRHMWTHYSEVERQEALARGEKHPPPTKVVQCDECGKNVLHRSLLTHKKLLHSGTNIMELCPHCGKSFKGSAYLRFHIRMKHEIVLPFLCVECGTRFRTQPALRKHHNAIHLKLRPFKCTMCPRDFSTRNQLTLHTNAHLNIRPFQCEHCPYAFTTRSLLRRHAKVYHDPGSNPKRKCFVRGPEAKNLDDRRSFK